MRGPTVGEVMTAPVITVHPGTSFKEVVATLTRHGISAVAVADETGRLAGVVSEVDLLAKEHQRGRTGPPSLLAGPRHWRRWNRAHGTTAADVMTRAVRTVASGEPVGAAVRILVEDGLRRVFVVDDDGRLAGVLARRDALAVFLRADEEIRAAVERDVLERVLWLVPGTVEVDVRDGVVTLAGTVERRSEAAIAVRLSAALPGVVSVRDELSFDIDDAQAVRGA